MMRPETVSPRRVDSGIPASRTPTQRPRVVVGDPAPGVIAISPSFELERFASSIIMADSGLCNRADALVDAFVESTGQITTDASGAAALTEFRNAVFSGVNKYPTAADFLTYADTVRMNLRKELNNIRIAKIRRDESNLSRKEDSQKSIREQRTRDQERVEVLNSLLDILNTAEKVMIWQRNAAALNKFLSDLTLRNNRQEEEVISLGEYVLDNRAAQVPTLRYIIIEAQRDQARIAAVKEKYPGAQLAPEWISPEAKLIMSPADITNMTLLAEPFTARDEPA